MESRIKNVFKFIFLPALFALCSVNVHAGGVIDTTKVVYLLDGKRVPAYIINIGHEKGTLEFITGANTSREALRNLGEKYRYGAYIYKSRKEGE